MKILLLNDDGYDAPGIRIMQQALKKYGDVTIIAPATHQSGKSTSLTIKELELVDHGDNIYSLTGTPADCASFATRYFAKDWDLVVSGCNNGLNLVYDTCYSGTIGAAVEANIQGFKALCFSTDTDCFDIVKAEINEVLDFIFANNLLSSEYLLSVNFPKEGYAHSKGYRLGKLGNRHDDLGWEETNPHRYTPYRKVHWNESHKDPEPLDSDLARDGYIVFTPLTYSMFSEKHYQQLKKTFKK